MEAAPLSLLMDFQTTQRPGRFGILDRIALEINMKPPILKDGGLFLVRCFASVLVIKTKLPSRFKVVFLVFRPISSSVVF